VESENKEGRIMVSIGTFILQKIPIYSITPQLPGGFLFEKFLAFFGFSTSQLQSAGHYLKIFYNTASLIIFSLKKVVAGTASFCWSRISTRYDCLLTV
jgi:hypothetical protein